MKTAFARILTELALKDERILLLTGDFCFGMFDQLKALRPKQYLNCGVCEQSMVGIAAGLAISNFHPVVYTITPFLLERAFEQIKLDIDQQNLSVLLVGFDDYPKDGPTHNPLNPKAMISLFHHTAYVQPYDSAETESATRTALSKNNPTFLRLRNAPFWPANGSEP